MQRRSILAWAALLASAGCLEVESIGRGEEEEGFHETGTIEVVVDGTPIDLSADRFQAEHAPEHDVRFHLHEGDERWHMERRRVTVAEAIDLLPEFAYDREGGVHVVTVDGATYDGSDPSTEIAFLVDSERVDPVEYDLRDGDHLVVEIATGE